MHRLDRETSGLMVFARTAKAEQILPQQFRRAHHAPPLPGHRPGRVEAQTIESRLVRDRGDKRRGSTKDADANVGRRAVTHVRPLERLGDYTLVECPWRPAGRTRSASICPRTAIRSAARRSTGSPCSASRGRTSSGHRG